MKTMHKDHPRGVVVAICRADGVIIRHDPGAWARKEWEKHEKERRRKEKQK